MTVERTAGKLIGKTIKRAFRAGPFVKLECESGHQFLIRDVDHIIGKLQTVTGSRIHYAYWLEGFRPKIHDGAQEVGGLLEAAMRNETIRASVLVIMTETGRSHIYTLTVK
jgi:hypothetical protein